MLDQGPGSGTQFRDTKISDSANIIDTSHLTQAQGQLLASYATGLINHLRSQLDYSMINRSGNTKQKLLQLNVKFTPGVFKFTHQIVTNYTADRWRIYQRRWHDVPAITRAARLFGLNSKDNYYENALAYQNPFPTKMSMRSAKAILYKAIHDMMFADKAVGYGHAKSLLGFYNLRRNYATSPQDEYFATEFDSFGNVHLILVGSYLVTNRSLFARTFSTVDQSLKSVSAKLPSANQTYVQAQRAYQQATSTYQQLQRRLNQDRQQLESAILTLGLQAHQLQVFNRSDVVYASQAATPVLTLIAQGMVSTGQTLAQFSAWKISRQVILGGMSYVEIGANLWLKNYQTQVKQQLGSRVVVLKRRTRWYDTKLNKTSRYLAAYSRWRSTYRLLSHGQTYYAIGGYVQASDVTLK